MRPALILDAKTLSRATSHPPLEQARTVLASFSFENRRSAADGAAFLERVFNQWW